MSCILVAGVGNIFCGDDAFGVEVVGRLLRERRLPPAIDVVDFGIRGLDLAYALSDDYDCVIVADAAARGEKPGTVSLLETEISPSRADASPVVFDSAHGLDPEKVLSLATTLGASCKRIFFVVCEPFDLGGEDGAMGLSDVVAGAVEPSVELIERLVSSLLHDEIGKDPALSDRSLS
ncbi:hydrogenase maturation protease [Methylocystis bryophila]|uniref:Hydrogenase maturation protease n=1 Tax=Methylocystis bryophila TaxID=655015 RepID=A0A1W6MUB1_9HYPH|nr:hydrogenase maturation protease [Methylocystis bryophila]ARN81191.1 hydrogenase maturation protease [Methylocystis bryophila]BDV37129.1 peptidase M52 [Methylocystis bryophila]